MLSALRDLWVSSSSYYIDLENGIRCHQTMLKTCTISSLKSNSLPKKLMNSLNFSLSMSLMKLKKQRRWWLSNLSENIYLKKCLLIKIWSKHAQWKDFNVLKSTFSMWIRTINWSRKLKVNMPFEQKMSIDCLT